MGENARVSLRCLQEKSSPDACQTFDISASRLNPGEYIGGCHAAVLVGLYNPMLQGWLC